MWIGRRLRKDIKTEEMIDIYHGSPNVIERLMFGEGKLYNDYGQGI